MNQPTLVFDCGATSAKVAIMRAAVEIIKLPGFNPHHHDWKTFEVQLRDFASTIHQAIGEIRFYGTGLGQEIYQNQMRTLLTKVFALESDRIQVHSDLMVCAHAAFDEAPVIIGILGTGSNIGFFDGHTLTRRTPSLGYLIGDEGSGVDIGKRMLRAHIYGQLPAEVSNYINANLDLRLEHVLEETYTRNNLRSLASSLSPIASRFYHLDPVREIVDQSLGAFIECRLEKECAKREEETEIVLFGSIAAIFEESICKLVQQRLNRTLKIHANPLRVLIDKLEIR